MKIFNPESLAAPRGYNHGLAASGNLLFVSGQIGWDKNGNVADGLANQFEQALRNIVAVVEDAGGKPENIGRFTIFIKDKQDYLNRRKEIGLRYQAVMGKHFPAMSLLIVKDLLEERALVEIEATAVLP
ncbi:RidA family protein [bacterium]|nr:RidA family protein [bacterium]MCI0606030.1 RidA family protein [bacterium]